MRLIIHPDFYHGFNKERNFYEGWYYKITDRTSEHVFALIPGIIRGMNDLDHESFLQVLDGKNKTHTYIRYGVDQFKAKRNEFHFNVANHEFSRHHLKLNHYDNEHQLLGELRFVDVMTWPDSRLHPGSMGWYNRLPLRWHHQVSGLYGEIVGKLFINGQEIDFTGGKVYIEKMWGRHYPTNYLWIQTGDFPFPKTALTCRLVRIPILGISRLFYFVAFQHGETIYTFTTLNRSRVKMEELYQQLKLTFTHNDLELTLNLSYKREDFVKWLGPFKGQMALPIRQTLTGQVRVDLVDTFKNKVLFSGIGESATFEFKGQVRKKRAKGE